MDKIVPIIIICIIALQLFFFAKNLSRMWQFKNIFSLQKTWNLRRHPETNLVDGLYGDGNSIFESILKSINKYLENNAGSVIDFGLLKDAVDRHCDSVEDDIVTQTPIPLYCGLAGTMAGVIVGLWDLLKSDAIIILMTGGSGQIANSSGIAAGGVNALLSGVAWAMVASICGIMLTTLNSILFKRCKLKEESGKNSFLAWMQSKLLPELPSDTSQALTNLVKNLNKFNNTFAINTSNLGNALHAVNQSYAIQADIIKAVHDMDVMKMAKANVRVLEELQHCTDKLEVFNEYLDGINGYTDAIHRFEEQFQSEADRIHVLEEIRDFFRRHKGEIAKTTADADRVLKASLDNIKESTSNNVEELHARFVEQSEAFKQIIRGEKEAFEQLSSEIKVQFSAQMDNMPQIAKRMDEISTIPAKLDRLIEKIERSNSQLVVDIARSIKQLQPLNANSVGNEPVTRSTTPVWMKFTAWVAIVIIAIACVFNSVMVFIPTEKSEVSLQHPVQSIHSQNEQIPADTLESDSVTFIQ